MEPPPVAGISTFRQTAMPSPQDRRRRQPDIHSIRCNNAGAGTIALYSTGYNGTNFRCLQRQCSHDCWGQFGHSDQVADAQTADGSMTLEVATPQGAPTFVNGVLPIQWLHCRSNSRWKHCAGAGGNISTTTLTLTAGGKIGSPTVPINAQAPNVVANAGGNVFITDLGPTTISGSSSAGSASTFQLTAPVILPWHIT